MRFLHPNTLLRLLRSKIRKLCIEQWRDVQWQGHLLDDLEVLRQLEEHYPDDSSVLKIQLNAGSLGTTVARAVFSRC